MYPNPDQYDTVAEDDSLLKKSHYGGTARSPDVRESSKLGTKTVRYAALGGILLTLIVIISFLVTYEWKKPVAKPLTLLAQDAPAGTPPASGTPPATVQAVDEVLRIGNTAKSYMDMLMEGAVINQALKVEEHTDPSFDKTKPDETFKQFYDEAKAAGEKLQSVLNEITDRTKDYPQAQMIAGLKEYDTLVKKAKQTLETMTSMAKAELSKGSSLVPTSDLIVLGGAGIGAGVGIAKDASTWISDWFNRWYKDTKRRLALDAVTDYGCMQSFCGTAMVQSMVANVKVDEVVVALQCMKTMNFASCFDKVTTADPLKNCMVCNNCTVIPDLSCSNN